MALTAKEYVEKHGAVCPYCLSEKIETTRHVEPIGTNGLAQNIVCNACDAEWTEEYKLVNVTELE